MERHVGSVMNADDGDVMMMMMFLGVTPVVALAAC